MTYQSIKKHFVAILDDPRLIAMPDCLWRQYVELHLLSHQEGSRIRLPSIETMARQLHKPELRQLYDLQMLEVSHLVFQEENAWYITDLSNESDKGDWRAALKELIKTLEAIWAGEL